ncbi:MAG: hypothetical protein KC621_30960 [Myxococcales bacterium]|nr:hypothetical protein [Myxococcales bacterium]
MAGDAPVERLRRWFGEPVPADLRWLEDVGVRSLGDLARLFDADLTAFATGAGRSPEDVLERTRDLLLAAGVPRPLFAWDLADVFGEGGVLTPDQERTREQLTGLLEAEDPDTVRQACELLVALADPALIFALVDLQLTDLCAERPSAPLLGLAPDLADIAATGLALALSWTGFLHLDRLSLRAFPHGPTCVSMVLDSPESRTLTALDVGRCGLTDADAIALASSPYLRDLRRLVASENPLGPEGVAALARMPLDLLDLRHVPVGAEGVTSLARSRAHVVMHVDDVGEEGAARFARSASLPESCRLLWAARLEVHRSVRQGGP